MTCLGCREKLDGCRPGTAGRPRGGTDVWKEVSTRGRTTHPATLNCVRPSVRDLDPRALPHLEPVPKVLPDRLETGAQVAFNTARLAVACWPNPRPHVVRTRRRFAALVRGCGQAYALQTVAPVTYRCGTRRVCQARSSGSERDTRARPHAVAPMNGVPEDSRRRSTCTGRTHAPRARADGHQTPSSTVAVRAPSPS